MRPNQATAEADSIKKRDQMRENTTKNESRQKLPSAAFACHTLDIVVYGIRINNPGKHKSNSY
jgi:hypothetical protein